MNNALPIGSIYLSDVIGLDGTVTALVSSTEDTVTLTYAWSYSNVSGPGILSFVAPTASSTTFSVDTPGTYKIDLTITSSQGEVFVASVNRTFGRSIYVNGNHEDAAFVNVSDAIAWLNANADVNLNYWEVQVFGTTVETTQPLLVPPRTRIVLKPNSVVTFSNSSVSGFSFDNTSDFSQIIGESNVTPNITIPGGGFGFGILVDSNNEPICFDGLNIEAPGGFLLIDATANLRIQNCIVEALEDSAIHSDNSSSAGLDIINNELRTTASSSSIPVLKFNNPDTNEEFAVVTGNVFYGQNWGSSAGGPAIVIQGTNNANSTFDIIRNKFIVGGGTNARAVYYTGTANPGRRYRIYDNQVISYNGTITGNSIESTTTWNNAQIANNIVEKPIDLTNITLAAFTTVGSNIEY